MKPGTHLHFVTCTLPRCRCNLLSLVLPPFAPALVAGHSFPARIAATAICGQTGRLSSPNLNRSTAKSANNRCMYTEGMMGESRCTAALTSLRTSRREVTEIEVNFRRRTAEHLAHRIGYVLKSFPMHRFWDYAMEPGQVPVSRITGHMKYYFTSCPVTRISQLWGRKDSANYDRQESCRVRFS
jgi:hypothetical protein